MKKEIKKSTFTLLVCIMMIISSMSVFAAGSRSDSVAFTDGFGYGTVSLDDGNLVAWASTTTDSLKFGVLSTRVTGGGSDSFTGTGTTFAQVSARYSAFTFAESTHLWEGRSLYLYLPG